MITFITIVHVVVSLFLILVILLQAGKGGGVGLGMGGGGSQTVFGARGGQSFLGRVTSVSAGIFMLTSVYLAIHSSRSNFDDITAEPPAPASAPAQPAEKGDAKPASPADAKPAQPGETTPAQPAESAPK